MMTMIEVIADDVLNLLEGKYESVSVDDIKLQLNYPEHMIYIAIGSLIQDGYICMTVREGKQYIVSMFETAALSEAFGEIANAWGGRML